LRERLQPPPGGPGAPGLPVADRADIHGPVLRELLLGEGGGEVCRQEVIPKLGPLPATYYGTSLTFFRKVYRVRQFLSTQTAVS